MYKNKGVYLQDQKLCRWNLCDIIFQCIQIWDLRQRVINMNSTYSLTLQELFMHDNGQNEATWKRCFKG